MGVVRGLPQSMIETEFDWHVERRVMSPVKTDLVCACGEQVYQTVLEVKKGKTFTKVHQLFCPGCNLQMRSAGVDIDGKWVRSKWKEVMRKARDSHE